MRRLINYIRSCFCKHEWELIFDTNIYGYDFWGRLESMSRYHEKTYRCKKCGMEKKYQSN